MAIYGRSYVLPIIIRNKADASSTSDTADAQTATGVGASNDAQLGIAPTSGGAAGSGAAGDVAGSVSGTSGEASGTGAAGAPAAALAVNTTTATGAGGAGDVAGSVSGASGSATGTGAAGAPAGAILVNPTAAAGSGAALDATVATGIVATAGTATGAGAGNNATLGVAPGSGSASGAGSAGDVAGSVSGTSGTASGAGGAGDPAGALQVNPITASGVGAANNATILTGTLVNAGVAAGAGVANSATLTIAIGSGAATGAGTANDATVVVGTVVNSGTAAGVGAANNAQLNIAPGAGTATGVGAANNATVTVSVSALAGVATATGIAIDMTALVAPGANPATGMGSANAATITGGSIMPSVTTSFGPCPWDPILCCTWPTGSEAVTGNAILAATESLWQASGQRYGLCTSTIRPCRRDCFNQQGWPFSGGSWWEWTGAGTWPQPLLYKGLWYNITCGGGCGGDCSCGVLSETILPGPVAAVTQVMLDGSVLASGSYRLDDNAKLVRTDGGMWPTCQDMASPDTASNTWSVTFQWGETVPTLGRLALGELACEYARACMGEECRLPKNVASLARQGVQITFPTNATWLERLFYVPQFVDYGNPHELDGAPMVYDIDGPTFRREGT